MAEQFNISQNEEKIIEFWKKNKIFEKSLRARKKYPAKVFYEGPPTANGRPGIHHVIGRSFKDLFCRYASMKGFYVERKAGWDTHGLPVEIEVEKKLGFRSKQDIESYGIAKFNRECKNSVWTYKEEWERITQRIGFWLDLERPYVTYENNYMESVWSVLKKVWDKKLLYKGHKVVPFCTRCGTPLSSHEVAQGYKETVDPSIYVKFKIKKEKDTYFLVWTTTPWTLPSNVALAGGENVDYVKVRHFVVHDKGGKPIYEDLILAKDIFENSRRDANHPLHKFFSNLLEAAPDGQPYPESDKVVAEMKGKELLGTEYEALYSFMKSDKKSHYVVGADFVSTEDGTGLVHIAPAFGEDDMNVGRKHNLPVLMTVEETGKFKKEITPWAGVFVKAADKSIIEELESRNLMFFSDHNGIKHEYPFCWRCSTPLLYYAKESWFIKMSQLRKDLLENNKKVNWVPVHLKEGRFGEWLKEVKDWALSRERYWATPLPIWECEKCGDHQIVGAIDDLESLRIGSKNNFFLMRHGHSENNQKKIVSCYPEAQNYGLTADGEKKTKISAEKLKKYLAQKKFGPIDVIFSSDLERTKHTAKIVKEVAGFAGKIIFDERLREVQMGVFNNKTHKEYQAQFSNIYEKFEKKVDGGENWQDVKKRMMEFLHEIDQKYSGKNILIVSHGEPIWILSGALEHLGKKEQLEHEYPQNAEWCQVELKNFPYNEDGNLDLHRPYIDEIKIKCKKCGSTSKRVKDVIDVWFDSGAMPYAQIHWPFDKKQKLNYPAEFIAEGIDQTRGWFYTLLAIATLLGKKSPYKNVISYGHVLDKDGQKMSKSKGNMVNPWDAIQKFGSDGVRWYFYVVNSAGEPKRFDEKEVMEHVRKFILLYYNTFKFLSMHVSGKINLSSEPLAEDPLDKWIISRLNSLKFAVAKSMDAYDATTSARKMEDFIEDLSVWYLRRSRKRLSQPKDKKEKEAAQKTLAYVLLETSKISAPFVPFFAEEMYQSLKKIVSGYRFEESVHMELFPKAGKLSEKTEHQMKLIRDLVTMGHRLRAEAQIKVRQPLNTFYIISKTDLEPEMLSILADELNVKKIEKKDPQGLNIKRSSEGGVSVALDTEITPALREEGIVRDLMRNIQEARKELALSPKDKAVGSICAEDSEAGHAMAGIIEKNLQKIKKDAILSELKVGVKDQKLKLEKEFQIEGVKILITLR